MEYELTYLTELLNLEKLACLPPAEKKTIDIDAIEKECSRILLAMKMAQTLNKKRLIRPYVVHHQQGLIMLLKSLYDQHQHQNFLIQNKENSILLKASIKIIAALLEDLEMHFSSYWNEGLDLPPSVWTSRRKTLGTQWIWCLEQTEQLMLSPGLLLILKTELSPALDTETWLSAQQIAYLEGLIQSFSSLLQDLSNCDNWDIILILLEMNFNAPVFYKFCSNYLLQKIGDGAHLDEHYRSLSFTLKVLKQIIPRTDRHYQKELPSISTSLINFIQAEIDHVRDIDRIANDLAGSGLVDRNFRVSFTVKQLAFFIHLQVECGIILEERPKTVHKYITSHYNTRDQESISEKSFKNAYYSRISDDMNKVIAKLAEMLAIAQETFNS
jgi:hypothetical protein